MFAMLSQHQPVKENTAEAAQHKRVGSQDFSSKLLQHSAGIGQGNIPPEMVKSFNYEKSSGGHLQVPTVPGQAVHNKPSTSRQQVKISSKSVSTSNYSSNQQATKPPQ